MPAILKTTQIIEPSSATTNITLDSSGNVGIGTSSPANQLSISSNTNTVARQLGIRNLSSGSTAYSVFNIGNDTSSIALDLAVLSSTNSSYGGNGSAAVLANAGNLYLAATGVNAIQLATNGVERMRINSSGHVTMPSQPFFMGYPTTDYSSGSMPTGDILFSAYYNNGSHYNATNGRFTAPTAGYYRTTWGGLQLVSTVTSLKINGTRTYNGNHWSGSGPSYINMTQTVTRYLNAGDYLNIEGWNGGGYYASWYLWTVELIG